MTRSLRTRVNAALWATAAQAGFDSARVHAIAAQALGRPMAEGFGLSTCDAHELGLVLEAVRWKAGISFTPPRGRSRSQRPPRLPREGNVARIATVAQLEFARSLEEQLHISPKEAAGIALRAKLPAHPRTSADVSRYIQALLSIKDRRQRQAAQEA